MKRPSKPGTRKWKRWLAFFTILLLASFCYIFIQLNFSYYTHTRLADLQERIGLHEGNEEEILTIIGHRGSGLENLEIGSQREKKLKPIGNTRTAIEQAIKARPHWIEIDLRCTKDGTLVVFHDEELDDKTCGKGKLSNHKMKELLDHDISVKPSEKILTLDEFGDEFLGDLGEKGIGLILDIKEKNISSPVLDWVTGKNGNGRLDTEKLIVFGEFEILSEYSGKGLNLGYTFTWKLSKNRLLYLFQKNTIIERLEKLDAVFLVVPVAFASRPLIERAKDKGIPTWIYGSDDQRDWDKVRSLGVTGIIVDYPAIAVDHFHPSRRMETKKNTKQADAADQSPASIAKTE